MGLINGKCTLENRVDAGSSCDGDVSGDSRLVRVTWGMTPGQGNEK